MNKAIIIIVLLFGGIALWVGLRRNDIVPIDINTIILISLDTTRADRLNCYGYEHQTTPHIDAIARQSLRYEHAFSPVPLTLPAHCSMFTGLIPPSHGVHLNLKMKLLEARLTLPEILQENGYTTYGIISAGVLDRKFGLHQGFDVYDDRFEKEIKDTHIVERSGKETTARALRWLDDNAAVKKFMFIHYFDAHNDYRPPPPFDEQFEHPYDGEIAFVDHCVGQIIDKLKALGLYEDALIIIAGDHGEMLGEHGESAHSYFIYQNALRVPLLFKLPGAPSARSIKEICSLVDVTPTILSLAGIAVPDSGVV